MLEDARDAIRFGEQGGVDDGEAEAGRESARLVARVEYE